MIYWYLTFLLPVVTGFAHLGLLKRPLKKGTVERVFLMNFVFWGIGIAGIFGFLVNSCGFLEDWIARDVSWPVGSGFQNVLGFFFLALGVLGIISPWFGGMFLLGTIVLGVVYGIGEGFVAITGKIPVHYLVFTMIYDWAGSALILMLLALYWVRDRSKGLCETRVPERIKEHFPK